MGAARHILIVDDNATNRKLLVGLLEAEGYTTSQASDGEEALRLLEKTETDAVISDILMPVMDGYRFCYEVRRSRKHSTIPFIFLTATYSSPSDEKHALDLGADRILKKPISTTETLNSLREILGNPLYQKPRAIAPIKKIDVLKQYTDGLVSKLEEKNVELQKRAEELKKLSRALEQTADSVIITNREGVIEFVNPAFEAMTGYTKEFVIGQTPAIVRSGKHDAEFYEKLWKAILSGKVFRGEFINRKSNGELFHEQLTISPVLDNEGKVTHFVSAGRDVTENKKADEQLRQTHGQLRHLLEHSPAVIYTLRIENERVIPHVVSENVTRLLGFTVAESTSFDWWAGHLHPEDREKAFASISHTIERGTITCEYRFQHKDLHYLWIEDNRRLVRDAKGRPSEIVGVWTDITARKELEEKLRGSAEKFRLIAENIEDLITILDLNGKRLYSSPSYKNILADPNDLIGTDSFEEIHPDDRDRIRNVFSDTLRTGTGQRAEFRFLARDGTIRHIESQGSTIRDEHGNISQILVVSRDVTEKKKLEAQFLRAQRMESIGTLAGGIAHDLNNVLAPILLGIQMLKKRISDEGNQRMLGTLEKSVQRGASMVNQVLAFARGISGERIVLQVGHLVDEMQKIAQETFPKSIQFRTDVSRNLWAISADPTQVHQVLLNLCVNARDAMPGGGSLIIAAANIVMDESYAFMNVEAKVGPYVVLTFTDTGTGIPPELIDKVFDPFFTTKDIGKGTGLGLSTVHSIVKSHGGFINVYSEVGRGTTFRVYFPAETTAEENQGQGEKAELPAGNGEVILFIDDEASIRDICRATLESYGYNVLTAADGTEAIVEYTQHMKEVRLVITDMMMPFMDGRSTIRALCKINPGVRIIATSGLMGEEKSLDRHNLSICAFLAKPYTAAELLTAVSEALTKDIS